MYFLKEIKMNIPLFATKIAMSQIFTDSKVVPVTILKVDDNIVVNKFFYSNSNKYSIQLGYQDIDSKNITSPLLGYFNKMNVKPKKYLKEFIVPKKIFDQTTIGTTLNVSDIEGCTHIKATGKSIGKGFAGVMKRHNFKGFSATHGTHEMFRHGGSIGCSTKPGRVFKGKKMPGQMGNKRVTVSNIQLVKTLVSDNLLLVRGAVPGCSNSIVYVKGYNL
jgi:large subunit ribosomal protein L3